MGEVFESEAGLNTTPKKRKYTPQFIADLTQSLLEWIKDDRQWWLGQFALANNCDRRKLSQFAQENEEFAEAYYMAKQWQENILVEKGINGEANPTMCIFALKNVSGWRDQNTVIDQSKHTYITKIEVNVSDDTKIPLTQESRNSIPSAG